jgi:hypothetical protein
MYTVETDSGAMAYIPSFIKTGSGIQKFVGEDLEKLKHRQHGHPISLLSFFQNKESELNNPGTYF